MKQSLGILAVALVLAGCSTPPPPKVDAPPPAVAAPAPAAPASAPARDPNMPPAECLAVLDRLSRGIPRDETGPALRAKGLRIKTPIVVPPEAGLDPKQISAARVRVMINNRGMVVPGSLVVQEAVGDPALATGISAAAEQTLSFDLSGAFTVPKEFAFTTVYVNCARP